ncbi:class I SAM-dependent methyltransferase [Pseudomonadota bacterium]
MTLEVVSDEVKTFEVKSANLGTMQVIHRDCPLCGFDNSDEPDNPYSYDVWTIKDCAKCGLTYIDRGPDYSKLFEELSWETTTKVEEQRRADLRPVGYKASKLTRLRMRLLPRKQMTLMLDAWAKPGNVIDLGCGDGGQMANLSPGFVPFGIEISTELAQGANQRFAQHGGSCVNAPTLDGLKSFPDGFFAAATLRSYLEHEMNPLPVLRELSRVLQPGGVAIVKVPNYGSLNRVVMGEKWCGFRYPDHLNYFTPQTLKKMATKAGFKVHFGLTYTLPTSDNMYAVLEREGGNCRPKRGGCGTGCC